MGKAKGLSVHLFVVSLQRPQNWGACLHLKDIDHLNRFNLVKSGQKKTATEHLNDHKNTETADVA